MSARRPERRLAQEIRAEGELYSFALRRARNQLDRAKPPSPFRRPLRGCPKASGAAYRVVPA